MGGAYEREFFLSYLGVDAFFSNLRKLLERIFRRPGSRFRYDPRSGDVDYLWDRELKLSACSGNAVVTNDVIIWRYIEYLKRIDALVHERGSELVLLWNPIPVEDQLAHLRDAGELFIQFGGVEKMMFRLPPGDERLLDGSQYHDPGHFKPELVAAILAEPKNRVPFLQILNELQLLQNQCH